MSAEEPDWWHVLHVARQESHVDAPCPACNTLATVALRRHALQIAESAPGTAGGRHGISHHPRFVRERCVDFLESLSDYPRPTGVGQYPVWVKLGKVVCQWPQGLVRGYERASDPSSTLLMCARSAQKRRLDERRAAATLHRPASVVCSLGGMPPQVGNGGGSWTIVHDASVRFNVGTRLCVSGCISGRVYLCLFSFWGASVCVCFQVFGIHFCVLMGVFAVWLLLK